MKIFKTKVIVLIVCLLIASIALVGYNPAVMIGGGVSIKSVQFNSAAMEAGISNPSETVQPIHYEVISSVNGIEVNTVEDYHSIMNSMPENISMLIITNQGQYSVVNNGNIGLTIIERPRNNLRLGLDLSGGTRVLLTPEEPVSEDVLDQIVDSLDNRLNVYGVSDVVITKASDIFSDDQFIVVEIAGASQSEVTNLLQSQGKFEARIANQTVFSGNNEDITYVCRSADCSGIDPFRGCQQYQDGYVCGYAFSITLSSEAAQRQADITSTLDVLGDQSNYYLSEPLNFYLDGVETNSLQISANLKGRASTNIQITGSGSGLSQTDAVDMALQDMKTMQTILMTGSLPVNLDIVRIDSISATLGTGFLYNLLVIGLVALLAVATIIYYKYRETKLTAVTVLILLSEIVLILGFAAFFKWQLDLAAIAGILLVIGTGIDHLIIITDEMKSGTHSKTVKGRIKDAMAIVFGAYITTLAGMLPLFNAGAGLLKGFAFTTIIGVSVGVLIARPAFASILQSLYEPTGRKWG